MSINKNIFYTFLTQIPVQLLGIVSGIFIARMIGPEGKGVFALYQANAQIAVTFFSLSFSAALTYFIPSGKIRQEKLLGMSLIIALAGFFLIAVVIALSHYLNYKSYLFPESSYDFLYMFWLLIFSCLSMANTVFTGFFQGLKLFGTINRVLLINSILNILFFGTFFIIHYYDTMYVNVQMLLYCLLLITLINTTQFFISFRKKVKIIPDFKISFTQDIKPILNFTLYTHLASVLSFFNNSLSLWVLNAYLNEAAIGLFSLASNLIIIFNVISSSVGNVLMPSLSGQNDKNKKEMFYTYSRINFTILFITGLLGFFLAVPLIPLIYGEEFSGSILLFHILLPGFLLSCTSRLYAVFIAANNKQLYNLYSTIVGFVVNVLLNYFLIKNYGLVGAPVTVVITFCFVFLSMMYYSHIKLHLPFGNYFLMSFKEIKIYLLSGLNLVKNK